jgi:phosphonate transport system substrate-binding protein
MLAGCGQPQEEAESNWRDSVKELRIAVTGSPQATPSQLAGLDTFKAYMERSTGLPVRVYRVSDYNSAIQALASGQIDLANMGAGSYANVHDQIGDLAAPILLPRGANGETGYYSALIVRADSPFRSVRDLKGRSLAVVDLNSTSGYLMPMRTLRNAGIEPNSFFSRIGTTGGHEQSVIAVQNGRYDAAFVFASNGTPRTGFMITAYSRMSDQGMIPRNAMREIWFAGPLPNEPFVMRTDRPQGFKDLVRGALAALPYEAPDAWTALMPLPGMTLASTDDTAFADVFALREAAIAAERGAERGAQ